MPKRIADFQITLENYDEEEKEDEKEQEAVGIPQAADEEKKNRVIKVARRKGLASVSGKNPFASFTGFGTHKPQTSFGASTSTSNADTKKNGTKEYTEKKSDEYYAKLKALNESVTAWIKQHVDKNPYCILTPVFRDYEKHLEGIEKQNADKVVETENVTTASSSVSDVKVTENKHVSFDLKTDKEEPTTKTEAETVAKPMFSFVNSSTAAKPKFSIGNSSTATSIFGDSGATEKPVANQAPFVFGVKSETKSDSDTKIITPKFGFGAETTTAATDSTPKFSFSSSSVGGAFGGFSFGGVKSDAGAMKPFSFTSEATTSSASQGTTSSASQGEDDEEYIPPKPEVSEIKEEGATYSKRCKLFWYVKEAWKERGLGNLHLKPLDSGKVQLIIRADTNLGNIILNIMLNDTVPISRSGKNMVNLVCIPDPPFEPKAEPKPEKLLLKVKTGEDADELFKKLEEAKSK